MTSEYSNGARLVVDARQVAWLLMLDCLVAKATLVVRMVVDARLVAWLLMPDCLVVKATLVADAHSYLWQCVLAAWSVLPESCSMLHTNGP